MGSRARIAAVTLAVMVAASACGTETVTVTPTPAPSTAPVLIIHSTPSCDGTDVTTPYANFAADFNAGRATEAAARFGGAHGFSWWDPSDPSGDVQTLEELPDHFAHLYKLGVRLPPTIHPRPPAGQSSGEAGFVFDDNGFAGKGGIVCQTAKISYLVIEAWTKTIAGRARMAPPGDVRQNGSLGPALN